MSRHAPVRTFSPWRWASSSASEASRDLPAPASPLMRTSPPTPPATRATRSSSRVRSATRPTYGVIVTCWTVATSGSWHGTSYRCHGDEIPLRSNIPRSSSSSRAVPSTMWTVSEARMPPGGARLSMRRAMITVSPWTSPSSSMISPVCSPMRMCTGRPDSRRLRRAMSSWISRAQLTARRADVNTAISPSPSSLTITPRWASTRSSANRSVARPIARASSSPSNWLSCVDSTRSVNSTVTVPSGMSLRRCITLSLSGEAVRAARDTSPETPSHPSRTVRRNW